MKFTAIPTTVLTMAMMAMPSLSSAQTLEEFWNLEDPSFNYTNKNFIMTYKFSNGIQDSSHTHAKVYLYGDRDDPNSDLNCMQGDEGNNYDGTILSLTKNTFGSSGDTDYWTGQEETVNIALDTLNVATDATIYTDEGDGVSVIAFCVRYGLYTEDHTAASSYEVNFLETLVELTVDLKGDFTVTDIRVAPKDKLKRTANQDYDLEAFQCSGKTAAGGIPDTSNTQFNQGDVITVCVQPNLEARNDNVYMKQIEYFEYVLLDLDGETETNTRQLAIDIDNTGAGLRGTMFGLTNIDNCIGEVACKIETILFATFYTREGIVTGTGTGTMQFGTVGFDGDINNRKLRGSSEQQEGRALEEGDAATGEFDVNFEIGTNDSFQSSTSGATSSMTILGFVGAAAGVLML